MGKKTPNSKGNKAKNAPITNFFKKCEDVSPIQVDKSTPFKAKHNKALPQKKKVLPVGSCKETPIEIVSSQECEFIPPTPDSVMRFSKNGNKGEKSQHKKKAETVTPQRKTGIKFVRRQIAKPLEDFTKNKNTGGNKLTEEVRSECTKICDENKHTDSRKTDAEENSIRSNEKPKKSLKLRARSVGKATGDKTKLTVARKRAACEPLLGPELKKSTTEKASIIQQEDEDILKGYGCTTGQVMTKILKDNTDRQNVNTSCKKDSFDLNNSLNDIFDDVVCTDLPKKERKRSRCDSFLQSDDSLAGCEDLLSPPSENPSSDRFALLTVFETSVNSYVNASGLSRQERIVRVNQGVAAYTGVCHLRDDWFHMNIEVYDMVFVSGLSANVVQCVLDNQTDEFITVFPNTLISGTTIATGISCDRNAVLNERFKTDSQNEAMLLGTITHDLFEWTVQNNAYSLEALEKEAIRRLGTVKYLEMLYALDVDETHMMERLREYFPSITNWWLDYRKSAKQIEFKTGSDGAAVNSKAKVQVDDVIDVEENIWAPRFGLKGKIDVSVKIKVHRPPKTSVYKVPLELKTGKMFSPSGTVEHRAQVTVYSLLMSERYGTPIDAGLLYYFKTQHLQGVPIPSQERRAIIIKRNELARHLTLNTNNLSMPGMLGNERTCKRCFQRESCMMYHRAVEGGDLESSGVAGLFAETTDHLTASQMQFFAEWYELIMIEAMYDSNKNKPIWLQDTNGKTESLRDMVIVREDKTADSKFHYTFGKAAGSQLANVHFVRNDRVIISEDNENVFNLTIGYILDVSEVSVTISAMHKINPVNKTTPVYRLDRDNTLSTFKTPLATLVKMLKKDSVRDEKICSLIVDLQKPTFSHEKALNTSKLLATQSPKSPRASRNSVLHSIFSNLNHVQKEAIERCLSANDYLLILGMPGAGKSTTIACLVRALISMGKSVLLTSYTHSAVDTILTKLIDSDFDSFVRLGDSKRVHPRIAKYTSSELTKPFTSTHELRTFYNNQRVVATTCLGVNHPLFLHKHFDYCVVDEASQVTLPVCVGPLRYAKTFVLVGDHNQLPPLVQSPVARKRGLEVSLFKLLSDNYAAEAVISLNQQYRMNDDIMSLTNHLVYENQMHCGNDSVANAKLKLNNNYIEGDDFLTEVINPSLPVVFVDTLSQYKESRSSNGITNECEARLVARLVNKLVQCGLTCKDIGIISPYRCQLKAIREQLSCANTDVEVDTIDRYQGKDKECIIVSFVRSNDENEAGGLLADWQRVNVAITRAKTKLILIGSTKTITNSAILEKLVKFLTLKKRLLPLRPDKL